MSRRKAERARAKPATECPHNDRPAEARGMCSPCYQAARRRGLFRRPEASPERGPTAGIPAGLELAGRSTRTDAEGNPAGGWDLMRRAGGDEPLVPVPDTHHLRSTAIAQRGDGSVIMQWTKWAQADVEREAATLAAWERHAALYAGLADPAPAIDPAAINDDLLVVYPWGDPHLGMLAWAEEAGANYDLSIALSEVSTAIKMAVAGAEASRVAILANLGDALHAQDDTRKTPGHGNLLDVDGRHAKVLDAAHALFRKMVDTLLAKHHLVIVRNLPGNHDPRVAAEFAMWLRAVYEREPRVIVCDAFAAHQWDRFGNVLLGWHHGDRTPQKELVALMATDCASDWGETEHHHIHIGHVHHKSIAKDHPGGTVESHRILAPGDAWHAGRYRAERAFQSITYHYQYGEVSRKTVGIRMVHGQVTGRTSAPRRQVNTIERPVKNDKP